MDTLLENKVKKLRILHNRKYKLKTEAGKLAEDSSTNISGCADSESHSEVGDDKDFNYNSPDEAEDEVDSDFSIDENDDPKSDPEDEETARKKVKVCRLNISYNL